MKKVKSVKYLIGIVLFFLALPCATMAQGCYWQQEVYYKINVDFNVKKNRFHGEQTIAYTNNSPDTLHHIYMHLYFNAFEPGSMMDERSRSIVDPDDRVKDRILHLEKDEIGYQHINSLSQDGESLEYVVDGTILSAELQNPLLPGATTEFALDYDAQVPIQIRRSGRDNAEGIEYSMTQWYPKLAEYDEYGWHPTLYVAREFYGVWGTYEVNITIDRDYIIGASGFLQNPDEIGYGYSEITEKPKTSKKRITWKFKAERVHDFAWAADPDYTHTVKMTDTGVEMHFFYQKNEKTAGTWARLPEVMNEVFAYQNKMNGPYPYGKYSFIQGGDGGMEYPMATLITGERSFRSLVGVSVHELLHSWYQGVLGTDESRYPWMDEGFTTYFSTFTMNHLKKVGLLPEHKPSDNPYKSSIQGYVRFVKTGLEEPMSTLADFFNTNSAYGVSSYVKGGVFLHGLKYMMGEEKFYDGMIKYFHTWKFKHPQPYDFIEIMKQESGLELNWYLNNMMNTLKVQEYGIDTLVMRDGKTILKLVNNGTFPMPVDMVVELKNGTEHFYTIPLRIMFGHKDVSNLDMYASANVLPDWIWTSPQYECVLPFDGSKIKQITIDPRFMLPDMKRENNTLYPPE